ncbi:unnamed protein product [Camellia sinensis]
MEIWSMVPLSVSSVACVKHRMLVIDRWNLLQANIALMKLLKEKVNAKLLEANPEYLTTWNYKKFAVEHILSHSEITTEIDPDSIKSIYSEDSTERAFAKNYTSYGAWYHRKWVLSKRHSSVDQELQLLGVFLKKDSRNFHAWNYRSVILSHLLEKRAQGSFSKEEVLTEEYDLVHQALFTDPDDQSGWFYHLWLLEQTVKVENPLLVSTWPLHGSNLNVSADNFLDTCALSPITVEVFIQPHRSQHAEMKSAEMISCGDENLHTGETHLQEPTQIKIFNQLRNSEVNESTASKWSAETIVNEIALFWELLSEINCYVEFIHEWLCSIKASLLFVQCPLIFSRWLL